MCQFIEEAFDVDSSNSEDVSQRLRPTEFGYRSVHYIVLVNAEKLRDAGVAMAIPAGSPRTEGRDPGPHAVGARLGRHRP